MIMYNLNNLYLYVQHVEKTGYYCFVVGVAEELYQHRDIFTKIIGNELLLGTYRFL